MPFPVPPHPAHLPIAALNALIAREPWARERLQRHAGKTVRWVWSGLNADITLTEDGLLAAGAGEADVTLTVLSERITLDRLRAGAASATGLTDSLTDLLHIAGDAALAQTVAELAQHLRPDLQDLLAERVGDVAAVRITRALQGLRDAVRTGGARLAGNVAEYLSEEAGMLAARPALADARAALDELDARINALTARVAALPALPQPRR